MKEGDECFHLVEPTTSHDKSSLSYVLWSSAFQVSANDPDSIYYTAADIWTTIYLKVRHMDNLMDTMGHNAIRVQIMTVIFACGFVNFLNYTYQSSHKEWRWYQVLTCSML